MFKDNKMFENEAYLRKYLPIIRFHHAKPRHRRFLRSSQRLEKALQFGCVLREQKGTHPHLVHLHHIEPMMKSMSLKLKHAAKATETRLAASRAALYAGSL